MFGDNRLHLEQPSNFPWRMPSLRTKARKGAK